MKADIYFSKSDIDSETEFRQEIQMLFDIYGKENVEINEQNNMLKISLNDFSIFYRNIKEHVYNKIENYHIRPINNTFKQG